MIVKKTWESAKGHYIKNILMADVCVANYTYTGWFLFGIIPLYIVRE